MKLTIAVLLVVAMALCLRVPQSMRQLVDISSPSVPNDVAEVQERESS
jgi:hypothetical protein